MVAVRRHPYITPQVYLQHERKAAVKSEYINGQIYAMAGASRRHNCITFNVAGMIYAQLQGRPCEGFANDMRVKIAAENVYTYPDIVVACGEAKYEDAELDTLLEPTLLIEVLSDSTEKYDRGKKSAFYQQIESLQEYVLISQDQARIECYTRAADHRWMLTPVTTLEDSISLESIGCVLPLAAVYARVQFEGEEVTDPTDDI
jgi:Uma2 family endonuclease